MAVSGSRSSGAASSRNLLPNRAAQSDCVLVIAVRLLGSWEGGVIVGVGTPRRITPIGRCRLRDPAYGQRLDPPALDGAFLRARFDVLSDRSLPGVRAARRRDRRRGDVLR